MKHLLKTILLLLMLLACAINAAADGSISVIDNGIEYAIVYSGQNANAVAEYARVVRPSSNFNGIANITSSVIGEYQWREYVDGHYVYHTKQLIAPVTSIDSYAFNRCNSLTSVTIPSSITEIGRYAFSNCNSLTSMIVENGNRTYDSRGNCNAIIETGSNTLIYGCQNTNIPNSITTIGDEAFRDCLNLKSIEIPNSVIAIGDAAFLYCSNLTNAIIGNSVTSIGNLAFNACRSLTNIIIPNSVTHIGDAAFQYCGLKDVIISNSLTSIGECTFQCCDSLKEVIIPNSVITIKDAAFSLCI